MDVQIVMPHGAMGASPNDSPLESFLRELAVAAKTEPLEWSDKYGTNIENDTFMMHRFCWCDGEDCPWCVGCECPEESYHYFVDGKEVSYEQYNTFFAEMTKPYNAPGKIYPTSASSKKWTKAADEANSRREVKHDPVCDYCTGKGIFERFNSPGKGAPHFWYKPLDFKVWWYKYIGRDMEQNKELTPEEFEAMKADCLKSLEEGR